jgi:dihydrolipoamide dehydrogenase
VAAIRAAQLGLRVALVEKENLGGVCLNWGCIPTKALLRNAEVINLLDEGRTFGFELEGFQADYAAAVKRSRKVSARLVKGVGVLMRKNDVQVVEGVGRIIDPHTVHVDLNQGGEETLETGAIVVATGARARSIPGVEVDGERVITYRPALAMRELPESVVVVGAGPIGMEFAHVWRSYGAEVTIVEMMDRLVPLEDEEVSAQVERAFKRRKVRLMTSTRVEGVEATGDGVRVTVQGEDEEAETLEADQALIAIGVQPNSKDLGLEEVGVELEKGWVQVDEHMHTGVENIYAIGDVTGKMPLAHVASAQGIVAVEAIAGHDPQSIDYDAVPRCTYCQPQVASFGLTEAQARQQGHEVKVGQFPFLPNGKALALAENQGFVKLVADAETGRLLGAHLVGPEVTELLPELVLTRTAGLSAEAITHAIHAHPTLNEALAEAAHAVFDEAIHI